MTPRTDPPASPPAATDLRRLHGRSVLVRSTRDHGNPPTGCRGTLEVIDSTPGASPEVRIAIDFPQMFTSQAHHRTLVLDDAALRRLLDSETNGTFEFAIDDPLE